MKTYKKLSVWLILFFVFYSIGALSHKKNYFPINRLKSFLKNNKDFIWPNIFQKNINDSELNKVISPEDFKRAETSRFQLNLSFLNLRNIIKTSDYVAGSGGFAKFYDEVLFADSRGAFYITNKKFEFEKIKLPRLPGSAEYIDKSNLRVTSIAFSQVQSKLFVAYQEIKSDEEVIVHVFSIIIKKNQKASFPSWQNVFSSKVIKHPNALSGGGGKLAIADSRLFLTIGSFSSSNIIDETLEPQMPDSYKGKIYCIDINKKNEAVIFSIGHRNPQGLTIAQDKKIFEIEQGPQGGDELNLIERNKNYGWPIFTYGTDYSSYSWNLKVPNYYKTSNSKLPIYAWVPSIAASSIIQLHLFNKEWDGDFVVGGLKSQSIFRVKIVEGRVVFVEPIWIGKRIRDLIQMDERILLLTDDANLVVVSVNKDS